MNLFYAPDFPQEKSLPADEAKHAIKVLRLSVGDDLYITNGKGKIYRCEISVIEGKNCQVSIIEESDVPSPCQSHLHIAIAPVKNFKRFEWFLEKATEIGIHEITPIICEHNERRVVKRERAEKILVSAMKQSIKGYLPKLNEPVKFSSWLQTVEAAQKFIAHLSDQSKPLSAVFNAEDSIVIAIGPEGDFSENELNQAVGKGFVPITLGHHRLRTETAGVMATAAVHTINEMKK